jgi:hypothetical protein
LYNTISIKQNWDKSFKRDELTKEYRIRVCRMKHKESKNDEGGGKEGIIGIYWFL